LISDFGFSSFMPKPATKHISGLYYPGNINVNLYCLNQKEGFQSNIWDQLV
jgi:hypothetical protein